ncbi:MAG TPA: TonB-dependent receptor [Bryobacteraceae bacterium]|nr:TonB-dependent receptor [Bryobacteraceae bacterium]
MTVSRPRQGRALPLLVAMVPALAAYAQQPAAKHETIVVTGAYEPLALDEVDRSVRVLPVAGEELLSNTLIDFLRLDPSLDIRERAPNGLQADLSIRGGTFGQTLVLVDGQRMNDAQSGHHNMDIPLPLESIARIEVLRGSGSALYGSDATGGVVNVITRRPEATEFRLRSALGNFGVNQERGSLAFVHGDLTQHVAFSRDFSTGFAPDRDYRNLAFTSLTHLVSPLGATDVVLSYMDHPFGADGFYGAYNSWENTKTWFGSIRQGLGRKTEASFSFRRHSDLFVLYRDRPEVFTNHHSVESYQAALRRNEKISGNAALHYGAEGYHDSIVSNNLGNHSRGRAAGYASLDFHALRRFSFSLGAREEVYRSLSGQFSPSVSAGVWLSQRFKLRGGISRSFRIPSYTDLYYHDPANVGSPDLRPERAWSYEGALDWNAGGKARGEVVIFHRRETDGIDYFRRSLTDIWRATNIQNLRFTGVEASVSVKAPGRQQIDLRYTGLHGVQDALAGAFSKYAFNYPSQSAIAAWQIALPWGLSARTRVGAVQRLERDPYGIWDAYLAYGRGRIHPFLQFTNLTSAVYEEILGVRMPKRGVVGGVEIAFLTRTK